MKLEKKLSYLQVDRRQSKLLDKIKDGGINNDENFYKIYY